MNHSENIKQPQDHTNDHDSVQDRLDAARHGDEPIHKPQKNTNDDQDYYKINQGHGTPPSLPAGTRLPRLLRQFLCHCESATLEELANDICPFGDIFPFTCG
jgi:hypothetical protein